MVKDYDKQKTAEREQVKSLNPKNDALTDEEYYGADDNISTQVVTNYYYNPGNK